MNEPLKPGSLLVANSVLAIGLWAWIASWYLASVIREGPEAMLTTVFVGLAWLTAYWQYRGTFCGLSRDAFRAAVVPIVVGFLAWTGVVYVATRGVLGQDDREAAFLETLGTLVIAGSYGYFTGGLNLKWSRKIANAYRPERRQFALRDLLAMTIWIAAVAGMTRWALLSSR